ncbi:MULTISPECIES: response regulator transcription factor [unclassified Chryseobacterium]|uniref:response regulator transcription factor n=1 Tax=unclassified Chryseobacterium TaxID=2593645 RepID=UPI00100B1A15|nr:MULTISPECIES: response regulator transcription factor [unclassified Chryseobacterium]RXM50427.1 DNA-binding response regulator [Chryseobacterium sp. CH25]RXM64566.1 DNA-binding response regulator [Chryseobacterium sp. CH1]
MDRKIIIADDHFVVRLGTTLILESHYKDVKISCAESYTDLTNQLHAEQFDLLILDINMPESKYLSMIGEIKEIQPSLKILVFSVYDHDIAAQYIIEGADGYINKLSDENNILEAVQQILETGTYYSQEIVRKLVSSAKKDTPINPLEILSEREKEIFDLLVTGYGNIEISNELNLHLSTVSTYKARVYKKLNIKNTVDLVRLGDKNQVHKCK